MIIVYSVIEYRHCLNVLAGLVIARESSLSYFANDAATGLEISWNGRGILFLNIPLKYQGFFTTFCKMFHEVFTQRIIDIST